MNTMGKTEFPVTLYHIIVAMVIIIIIEAKSSFASIVCLTLYNFLIFLIQPL